MTTLTDGTITLRPPSPADVEVHLEAALESQHERWLSWAEGGYSLEASRAWIERAMEGHARDDAHEFFIFDGTGALLGGCGLNRLDRASGLANLGYWVRSSAAGRGVATAAARLVARYGLQTLQLVRIEIGAAAGNIPSQRVAEKLGAVREGVLRKRLVVRGEHHDMVLFSIVAGDHI